MSGDFISENDPNYNFKGWRKYLNSYTKRGRLNWVLLTYGSIFSFVILKKMFGGKKAVEDAPKK
ncbi:hypothetical protein NP493_601g02040 [Ridgeia piscesae]|uniref:Uncharacterized protein n=1 Tax=Ridgeia piscesae TaxID=27915 RepID=A0AAD9KTU5_RIDPI|nr:hypothetical protein NP493_601g02040 [Ridgeia piscesae]